MYAYTNTGLCHVFQKSVAAHSGALFVNQQGVEMVGVAGVCFGVLRAGDG